MVIKDNDPYTQPSFSMANRIARAVWGIVWLLFFRTSPRPFHVWRCWLLKLFGAKLGNDVHVYSGVRVWAPWQLIVGNRVGIADGVVIYNMAPITLGDNTVISQGAHLCGGSHDIDSSNFQLIAKPILIGDYAWICAEAFIGPGTTVAEGCVVAARCVLTKSITEPWTVWVGNPALIKRNRKRN